MLFGFNTENEVKAKAAMLIYVIYKSRDVKRAPSGLDMWGQIERFAKAAAKRSEEIDDFVNSFKRKMACSTINPYWMRNDISATNAIISKNREIMSFGIYNKTQIVILLVRDRLEREKMFVQEEPRNED